MSILTFRVQRMVVEGETKKGGWEGEGRRGKCEKGKNKGREKGGGEGALNIREVTNNTLYIFSLKKISVCICVCVYIHTYTHTY